MLPLRTLTLLSAVCLATTAVDAQSPFVRGDVNGSGAIDLADAIGTLGVLFQMQPTDCSDALDVNDDGQVNIADPISLLGYLFQAGADPAAPFPDCGTDPTADALDCVGPVANCPGSTATAFRVTDLDLRDPHAFASIIGICLDVTDAAGPGLPSLNDQIQMGIENDGDFDGLLDLSYLLIFRPLDPGSPNGTLDFAVGECTAPESTTVCDLAPAVPPFGFMTTNAGAGTCMSPVPGTTSGYSPGIATPSGPCFSTDEVTLTLDLQGIVIPLESAQFAGSFVGSPPDSIVNGLAMGFISEATADSVILPATIPIAGGSPLSALLPGGTGSCAPGDDRDIGPDGTTLGWWVYFNFTAEQVPYIGP